MTRPPQPEPSAVVAATAMYVEVLVIGIGFFAAIGAGVAAVAGPGNISRLEALSGSTIFAGGALAFSYALGILIDRAADHALGSVRRRLRARFFGSEQAYAQARQKLTDHPVFMARADYARSRLRICRGWIVNCAALTATGAFATGRFVTQNKIPATLSVTALGVLASLAFYAAWRSITVTGYRKLAEQTSQVPMASDSISTGHPEPSC